MAAAKKRKKRIPQLRYMANRNIGWHVSYRDPKTGSPKRHRFDVMSREEAMPLYEEWLADHLLGKKPRQGRRPASNATDPTSQSAVQAVPGSLLLVASSLIQLDEERTRKPDDPRTVGTISEGTFDFRRHGIQHFLGFLNDRYGSGAVARMTLADLTLHDVEAFNRELVAADHSYSFVNKRMALVKDIIDRSGRPEHGHRILSWNWDARDKFRGKPPLGRRLPSLSQLQSILRACDARGRALVWMGIGLGFGQGDISVTRVGQIDANGYDLRRGKTGIERYGETPSMVWHAITEYLAEEQRPNGELLFVTRRGRPLVHGRRCDAVRLWWRRLRVSLGETRSC